MCGQRLCKLAYPGDGVLASMLQVGSADCATQDGHDNVRNSTPYTGTERRCSNRTSLCFELQHVNRPVYQSYLD